MRFLFAYMQKKLYLCTQFMKKIIGVILCVLISSMAFGGDFSADKRYLSFPEKGGSDVIHVSSSCAWEVYDAPIWVDLKQTGNTLTVICPKNQRLSILEGDIILRNKNHQRLIIVVAQEICHDYLHISANWIEDSLGTGGVYHIDLSTNQPCVYSGQNDWCHLSLADNRLEVVLDPNKTDSAREAYLEVYSSENDYVWKAIQVHQNVVQDFLFLSAGVVSEDTGDGGTAQVKVDTNHDGFHIEGLPEWCELLRQEAASFLLRFSDNSGGAMRKAECRIIAGNMIEHLTILQRGKEHYVNVSYSEIHATADGGLVEVSVECDGDWRIVNLPEWCEVAEKNKRSFVLDIMPSEGESREAVFSVSSAGIRRRIELHQDGE